MKRPLYRILLLPILLSLIAGLAYSQPTPQTKTLAITLDQLAGNWIWEYLEVQGRPLTRMRDYYATGLRIDGEEFILDFSEEAFRGKIIQQNGVFVLETCESDKPNWGNDDAEVLKIKGDRLYIVRHNHVWPMFVNSDQYLDVVYCYRKRR